MRRDDAIKAVISVFVMYSVDRKAQFEQMIRLMGDMELYDECQRIVLADDSCNVDPDGWEIKVVPRENGVFSWARMWDEGVAACRREAIVYLDSDRILPVDYFPRVLAGIADDRFLYTKDLFNFLEPVDDATIRGYRDGMTPGSLREAYDEHRSLLWYDPRFGLPCDGPGKGAMSGSTAFTSETYRRSGGVDPWYAGNGAWADSDFNKQCHAMGMEMVDLGLLELHLHHEKLGGGSTLSRRDVEVLSLNNYVRYCKKWGLDLDRARSIAECLKLPDDFVKRVSDKLAVVPPHEDGLGGGGVVFVPLAV